MVSFSRSRLKCQPETLSVMVKLYRKQGIYPKSGEENFIGNRVFVFNQTKKESNFYMVTKNAAI